MSMQDHIKASYDAFSEFLPDRMHTLELMAEYIDNAFREGHKLLICGNGGSAADAQHIAAELVVRYQRERKALPAIALTVDSSVLTAGANDYGYQTVFERQVEALGNAGDVLWAISTSGTSQNVINACEMAQSKGMRVFSFTGADHNMLMRRSNLNFGVGRSTAITQQLHLVAAHAICDYIEDKVWNRERAR